MCVNRGPQKNDNKNMASQTSSSVIPANTIVLIANDGSEFRISFALAMHSKKLKNMIETSSKPALGIGRKASAGDLIS